MVLAALVACGFRSAGRHPAPHDSHAPPREQASGLYRWRDDGGGVRISGALPRGRACERSDAQAVERRNVRNARRPAFAGR